MTFAALIRQALPAVVLAMTAPGVGFSQTPEEEEPIVAGEPPPLLPEEIADGRVDYENNCMNCHGIAGKGDGPWADYMTLPPPDLTAIAERNDGTFPYYRIYTIIEKGRESPEHSFTSMPKWGEMFAEEPSAFFTDTAVEGRLLDLLDYLQSIQDE